MDETSKIISNQFQTTEENKFLARHQFYLIFIFSGLWFSYCWWLSEQYHFDFGQYTPMVHLLFCVIHVLTVWRCFQYMIKLIFRFYQFSRRLKLIFIDYLSKIVLTFVLFVLLTFVLNFKEFLQDFFALVE